MTLNVKILGPGCPKCKILKRHTQHAIEDLTREMPHVNVTLDVVREIEEIMRYDVLSTPVLIINEQVITTGKVPRTQKILAWLRAATSERREDQDAVDTDTATVR
jgi:glutaredoxin